jgi:EmrB/QacA subfamily drug resistance transporter
LTLVSIQKDEARMAIHVDCEQLRYSDGTAGRAGSPTMEAEPSVQRRKGPILLALCLAALIINIDVTIVNVALPSLVRELGATTTSLQWVVDAYTLVFAALILAAGSLSDRVGRKGVLLLGLGVFGVGSLAGSLATSSEQLIAARVVMGIGAAAIFPSTLSLISNVFTERKERAKAIGLWGATTGVGVATGPIVGGWLLEEYWWGSVFLFMVPVAAVVAALVALTVPTSRDPAAPPIDWAGLVLSSLGMGILIFSIIQAPQWGWGSPRTLATVAAGVVVLTVFVNVERHMSRPMLDVRLFRNPRFTAASGSITIGFFTLAGFTFLITQYFQFTKGYTPLGTGVRLLPVATAIAVASLVGTRLAVRIGNKAVVAAGLALWGITMLWVGTNDASTGYLTIAGQMLVGGGGLGLITAPATEAIMGAVSTAKAGVGSAVNDATRLFGTALGVAITGSVAASLYTSRLDETLPQRLPARAVDAADGSVGGALVAAQQLQHAGLAGPAHQLSTAASDAFIHSLNGTYPILGAIALGGALMAAALLPSRPMAPTFTQTQPALPSQPNVHPQASVQPSRLATPPHRDTHDDAADDGALGRTMWEHECSVETAVAPDALWRLWSDVRGWPKWNDGIEKVEVDGPFAVDTTFTMTPPAQQPVEMRIVEVVPGELFTDEMDGGDFVVRTAHRLERLDTERTRVIYRTEISGPAAEEVGPRLGPEITADFPQVLAALVSLASR